MAKVRYLETVKYQEDGVMFEFADGQVCDVSASTPDHVARGIAELIDDEPATEDLAAAPAA